MHQLKDACSLKHNTQLDNSSVSKFKSIQNVEFQTPFPHRFIFVNEGKKKTSNCFLSKVSISLFCTCTSVRSQVLRCNMLHPRDTSSIFHFFWTMRVVPEKIMKTRCSDIAINSIGRRDNYYLVVVLTASRSSQKYKFLKSSQRIERLCNANDTFQKNSSAGKN